MATPIKDALMFLTNDKMVSRAELVKMKKHNAIEMNGFWIFKSKSNPTI